MSESKKTVFYFSRPYIDELFGLKLCVSDVEFPNTGICFS